MRRTRNTFVPNANMPLDCESRNIRPVCCMCSACKAMRTCTLTPLFKLFIIYYHFGGKIVRFVRSSACAREIFVRNSLIKIRTSTCEYAYSCVHAAGSVKNTHSPVLANTLRTSYMRLFAFWVVVLSISMYTIKLGDVSLPHRMRSES